jgi:hypothetical protein
VKRKEEAACAGQNGRRQKYPQGLVFEKQIAGVREWLAGRRGFSVLCVNHAKVIRHPLETAAQINRFLGENLSVDAMAAAVHPELHRQRK